MLIDQELIYFMAKDGEVMDKDMIKGGYDPYLEAKILSTILLKSDEKNEFGFIENNIEEYFDLKGINIFDIEDYCNYFQKLDLITFDGFGEDGFYIQYWGVIKPAAKEYFSKQIFKELLEYKATLLSQIETLKLEKSNIMDYDQDKIKKEINLAKSQIDNILSKMNGTPLFDSIRPLVANLSHYITSVENINNTYENVFSNIIKPIKRESEAGVKATVSWAILSIIISTIISLIVTNWTSIIKFIQR
jgi:hypothetical protein